MAKLKAATKLKAAAEKIKAAAEKIKAPLPEKIKAPLAEKIKAPLPGKIKAFLDGLAEFSNLSVDVKEKIKDNVEEPLCESFMMKEMLPLIESCYYVVTTENYVELITNYEEIIRQTEELETENTLLRRIAGQLKMENDDLIKDSIA